MTDLDVTNYVNQIQGFKAADQARENLFSELIGKYSALVEQHANLQSDFQSERDNRRNYQKSVEERDKLVEETNRQLQANSFVLALIDGDGVIFQDALLQVASGDGGSEAASRLHYAIQNHVATLYSNSGGWPIMVQIYLSLDKLAMKLQQVGLLRHPQELRSFAQCFSVNQPLFSIIDVGHGKERADHKIKEMLRAFSDNPTCRHIIFGGCHDAGYLLNLDQFKHNELKAKRITLLESTPAYRGFVDLPNFKRARFDLVFRTEPLPENAPAINTSFSPPPSTQSTMSPTISRSVMNKTPPTSTPVLRTASPAPSTPASSVTAPLTDSSGEYSYAGVGKAGPTSEFVSIAPNKKPAPGLKKKYAYFNKAEQRLDDPLPPRDRGSAESLEVRMHKFGKKMCNHFHLGGKCEQGKFCNFQHEPRLTTGELNALRYKTRTLPCKNKYCENIDCYLGHQCSFERDSGYCPYPNTCHLRGTHGMDNVKYCRMDRAGNFEYSP